MKKNFVYYILTILWILFIFSFSLHPAEQSEKLSDGVGQLIIEHSSSDFFDEIEDWSFGDWKMFHKVIRKSAHFAEFFILGILMNVALQQTQWKYKRFYTFILCAVVAFTDETIQRFVPGRAGLLTDVLLDCCGSFVGIGISVIVINLFLQKRKNYD